MSGKNTIAGEAAKKIAPTTRQRENRVAAFLNADFLERPAAGATARRYQWATRERSMYEQQQEEKEQEIVGLCSLTVRPDRGGTGGLEEGRGGGERGCGLGLVKEGRADGLCMGGEDRSRMAVMERSDSHRRSHETMGGMEQPNKKRDGERHHLADWN